MAGFSSILDLADILFGSADKEDLGITNEKAESLGITGGATVADEDDGIIPTVDGSDSGSDSSDSSSDDTPTVVDDDFSTDVPGWTFGFTSDSLDAYGLNNNDLTSSYFSGIDLSGF
ncbi:MAG: hypothetical protein MRY32_03770 [Rickettsiales bacterium]|nr:hypothetical protein [Rickettsiales bacterium]